MYLLNYPIIVDVFQLWSWDLLGCDCCSRMPTFCRLHPENGDSKVLQTTTQHSITTQKTLFYFIHLIMLL